LSDNERNKYVRFLIGILVAVVIVLVGFLFFVSSSFFGYIAHKVDANEIGIRLIGGVYQETLGPGTYTDGTMFADLVNVDIKRLDFSGEDPEVLTSDLQRLGVTVSGTVARPGIGVMTAELWSQYREVYLNEDALRSRMSVLSQQAMKVCVGQRTFEEAAVGENRNGLTDCIDVQLSALAQPFGLDVNNVSVPNVIISAAVQASLDKLTDSRNATSFAKQEELRIAAETQRDLTAQQGQIVIEQGRVQEELEQRAISAALEADALDAEKEVITKQNENSLLQIQGDLARQKLQTSWQTRRLFSKTRLMQPSSTTNNWPLQLVLLIWS
jgi:hypothetical protein